MRSPQALGYALGCSSLALVAACGPSNAVADAPVPTPSASSSGPSPTASTTTTAPPVDADVVAAEQTVRRYYKVSNHLGQDPTSPLNSLATVARGSTLEDWRLQYRKNRALQYMQRGDTSLVSITGHRVAKKGRPSVVVGVCYDVSKVTVVNKKNESVVASSRAPRAKASYLVQKWSDGWFVTEDQSKGQKC